MRLRGILRFGVHCDLAWEGDGWQEYLMQLKVPEMNKPGEPPPPAGAEVGRRFCGGSQPQGDGNGGQSLPSPWRSSKWYSRSTSDLANRDKAWREEAQ